MRGTGIIALMQPEVAVLPSLGAVLFAAVAHAQTPVLACVADGRRIVVDRAAANGATYRYRAWGVRSVAGTPPELVLGAGRREVNGTGACRNAHYRFASGKTAYVVATPVGCTEDEPPADAVAQVFVFDGDELRTRAWCVR